MQAAIDVLTKRQGKNAPVSESRTAPCRPVQRSHGGQRGEEDSSLSRGQNRRGASAPRARSWSSSAWGPTTSPISGAACGGDLLFAEACLDRGLRLELRLPLLENEFLDASVNFAAAHWRDLYDRVKAHTNTTLLMLPQELRPTLSGVSAHERNNLWMLYSALALGADKVLGVLLWDREPADGPGGTQHMHDLIARLTGRTPIVIDPVTLLTPSCGVRYRPKRRPAVPP